MTAKERKEGDESGGCGEKKSGEAARGGRITAEIGIVGKKKKVEVSKDPRPVCWGRVEGFVCWLFLNMEHGS